MSLIICGIDPSISATGVCILDMALERPLLHRCTIKPPDASHAIEDRLWFLHSELDALLAKWPMIAAVGIEAPIHFQGRSMQSTIQAGQVSGTCLMAVRRNVALALYGQSSEIREGCGLGGGAKKPAVSAQMHKLLGLTERTLTLDESDAAACCFWLAGKLEEAE